MAHKCLTDNPASGRETQEAEGKQHASKMWPGSCTQRFCQHPIGQCSVTWPHWPAKEAGKCYLQLVAMCPDKTPERRGEQLLIFNHSSTSDLSMSSCHSFHSILSSCFQAFLLPQATCIGHLYIYQHSEHLCNAAIIQFILKIRKIKFRQIRQFTQNEEGWERLDIFTPEPLKGLLFNDRDCISRLY